jgi:hypothetical protein
LGGTKLGTSRLGSQPMRLGLLSEIIGRELELIGTEVAVGPYSADILAIISQPKRGTTIHARVPLNSGCNSMCATG